MTKFYEGWLSLARSAAIARGLNWNPEFNDKTGKVAKSQRWGLKSAVGLPLDKEMWMSHFRHHSDDIDLLLEISNDADSSWEPPQSMSKDWREFLQASISNELFIKQGQQVGAQIRLVERFQEIPPISPT